MTQRVTDSVGLLWTFVLLSAVVLAGGCLILSSVLYCGRRRTMPAVMSAPFSPFRCSMRQIALRGSPA
jgi:hypothetical protein